MVMLQRWSVLGRENDHVREVHTLMEGDWSCYRGGKFNGHITEVLTSMEGERSSEGPRWSV